MIVSLYTDSRVLSLASVHSTTSTRSYSARRFEREREQRLARERARANTPSPRSTDQLISDQRIVSCQMQYCIWFIKRYMMVKNQIRVATILSDKIPWFFEVFQSLSCSLDLTQALKDKKIRNTQINNLKARCQELVYSGTAVSIKIFHRPILICST